MGQQAPAICWPLATIASAVPRRAWNQRPSKLNGPSWVVQALTIISCASHNRCMPRNGSTLAGAAFGKFLAEETTKWSGIVRASGATIE